MIKNIFLTLTSIVVLIALTIFLLSKNSNSDFHEDLSKMFALSPMQSTKVDFDSLKTLPEPVQNYFKNTLTDGMKYISFVRLKHSGKFKPSVESNWVDIKGEEFFATTTPSFIWRGKIPMVTAVDKYIANEGSLIVKIFSAITVAEAKGDEANQGEFLRWITEAVLFPTSLLPSQIVEWSEIDKYHANLYAKHSDIEVSIRVTFDENFYIKKMETKRYMNKKTLLPWIAEVSNYKEFDGIKVPTKFLATWDMGKRQHTYVDFTIDTIEFDIAEKFN